MAARGLSERKRLLGMVAAGMIGCAEVYEVADADRVIGVLTVKALVSALPEVGEDGVKEVLWLSGLSGGTRLRDLSDADKRRISDSVERLGQWRSPPGWPFWAE